MYYKLFRLGVYYLQQPYSSFSKLDNQMEQVLLNNQMYWNRDFILNTNSLKHGAQRLKAYSWTQGWRWANHILQGEGLVEVDASIRIHTSVIHLNRLPLHWPCHMFWVTWLLTTPPRLFSPRGTAASLCLSLSHSLQHTNTKSRLTVSLPS